MTRAHISSRILLSNASPVLPEGMVIFPLDGRVMNTMDNIPISSSVVSYRNDIYKFMQCTAIEDSTTNLLTNPDGFSLWAQHYTSVTGNNVYNSSMNMYGDKIIWSGTADPYVSQIVNMNSSLANRTFTWSVYAWTDEGQQTEMTLFIYAATATTSIKSKTVTLTNVPTRYEVTWTFPSTETDTKINVRVDGPNTPTANNYLYAAQGQLEEKDHSTSYTATTRSLSSLQYDITALSMRDAGCISVWVYNSAAMVNNLITAGSRNNQYLFKLGSTTSDYYKDAVSIKLPSDGTSTNRPIQPMFFLTSSTGSYLTSSYTAITLGQGTWNHFVLQWDKNGLPSGNIRELYVNGVLDTGDNVTTHLPANYLTYLSVGDWYGGSGLMPCTFFEQLAIHPSKGFAPDVIESWYKSNAPFFDSRDMFSFV